jgi:DNA repair protein RadD
MATLFQPDIALFPLRPRQANAIAGVRQATREGHRRIIIQAPCRSGKTVMAAHIISGALSKGNRALLAVPRISLIGQTIKRFESQGICDIGVIQSDHERTNANADVQIASIQTLVLRPIPEVDVVIVDEVHIQNEKFDAILDSESWAKKIVIGLSATPWRKGMGRRWTKLVLFGSAHELIEENWLCPVVAYGVPDGFTPDRSKLHTSKTGDFVESEAEATMSEQTIVGCVVDTWIKHGPEGTGEHPGDRTFLFCVNRNHAKKMQEKFISEGISCGYIDGTMDADQREEVFKKYRTGEYKIIASIDTIGTGIDEDVRCIIYARLTKSEIRWVQDGSRGMTPFPGKEFTLVLDHAGTAEELGMFTDIHHTTLDARDPKDKGEPFKDQKPPKPYKCPKCSAIIPRGRPVCPICGTVLKAAKEPAVVDGELVAISGKKKKEKAEITPAQKEDFYSQLIHIADAKGRKRGWADWTFKEKFGHFPTRKHGIDPKEPSATVLNYVRSRNIAKAKAREKEAVQA